MESPSVLGHEAKLILPSYLTEEETLCREGNTGTWNLYSSVTLMSQITHVPRCLVSSWGQWAPV